MKSSTFYLLAILLLLSEHALAQAPGIEWQKTIGGSGLDLFNSLSATADGGYILAGSSSSNLGGDKSESRIGGQDYWVIKLDSSGSILWQNTIGGTGDDYMNSIYQTADGGYILGGFSNSSISGDKSENSKGGYDYWVVKLDSVSAIEWQNTIGGSGDDKLLALQLTNDGGYIVGGWSLSNISGDKNENSHGLEDYWLVKLDSSGNINWQNTIGGIGSESLTSLQQTIDGGYILGGYSNSSASGDKSESSQGSTLKYDYWAVKLDSGGNILWENTIIGNSEDGIYSLQQTADGGYILGGYSSSSIGGDKSENSQGGSDFWVVKLDSGGSILWQNTIGGSADDRLYSLHQTADGGYILGGSSFSNISGDKSENSQGNIDYWVVKLNSTGNINWQKTIGGSNLEIPYWLQQTPDGGYIIGGRSNSNSSGDKSENSKGNFDHWIIKLAPDVVLSNIVFLETSISFNIKISPNPFTESSTLHIDGLRENAELNLKVISTSGITVHQMNSSLSNINRTLGAQLMELPQGIYILQVTTPDGVRSVKVVR